MYGKLINGAIYYAPENYTTSNGELIVNFNSNEEVMNEYGFKEVLHNRPTYNMFTQILEITNYEETEDSIVINYITKDREPTTPTLSLEQRVSSLEKGVDEMKIIFSEEVNK